ncbi:hypothetical protein GUJ93_ZPchr0015g6923 [Zizania palustris]|uniref:SAM-dependent MTase DRM-type domain-containing protein n=1 Tax=Zizania palustris TaxID=103762 RepID=A0A8J5W706_ZIZPA|nr:hypothetical protein GUJ93_ZPchr0015g6923 [Zizania palustris]
MPFWCAVAAIATPARRRGPGPRPVTSFDYNLRQIPSSNVSQPPVHNKLVSDKPCSVSMGSGDGMKELIEKLAAKIDDLKTSLDKLAPLARVAEQLATLPSKVVALQSSAFENQEQGFLQEMSQKDEKIKSIVSMGFPEDEAKMAITRCGLDASVEVLVDSIYASETAGNAYSANLSDYEDTKSISFGRKKTKFMEGSQKKRKRYGSGSQGNPVPFDGSHEEPMPLPNPMVGFSLPSDRVRPVHRTLPDQAFGPPFFYYENVALAPKGVWTTISRFLYDIQPEFVDSKFFCAAARKRGYIHNLPIENRSPVLPLPPKTIYEAFPSTKMWWPSWGPRRQFNCLQTCVASAKLIERIRCSLSNCGDTPSPGVQKCVLDECRKWNLVWVGKNKVAPLEPDEMEFLLGYPRNHTRGVSRTERYRALRNSFQVDTVAYHLSVLRNMFPNGMNVLSLFSGIGGAEV